MENCIGYYALTKLFSIDIKDLQVDIDNNKIKHFNSNGKDYLELKSLMEYTIDKIKNHLIAINEFEKIAKYDEKAIVEYLRLFDEEILLSKLNHIFLLRMAKDLNDAVSIDAKYLEWYMMFDKFFCNK